MTDQVLLGAAQIIAPSFAIAIVVIIDARLFGPYFALSSLISGADGMEGDWWSESPRLRAAVLRRFIYPVAAGLVLGLLGIGSWELLGMVGLLAATLLLWPVLFGGVPKFSNQRDWEVPALYSSFTVAYTLLVPAGGAISLWIANSSDAEPLPWVTDQIVGSIVVWGGSVLSSAVFLGVQSSLKSKVYLRKQRQEMEYLRYELEARSERPYLRKLSATWSEHTGLLMGAGAVVSLATISALFLQNSRRRKE